METQLRIAAEKTKPDIVFDIIKNNARGGRITMFMFEYLMNQNLIAPNWRKQYLKNLAAQGKIRCDSCNVYVL